MSSEPEKPVPPVRDISRREFTWRIAWIGIQLILVYSMADEFQPFFYQAF